MEQTVEEAKNLRTARLAWHKPYLSGIVMMMGVARLRLLTQLYAVASFACFVSLRTFFASKKIYERQDWLAIRSFSEGWWA